MKWCFENRDAAERMTQAAQQLIAEKYENNKVIASVTEKLELLLSGHILGRSRGEER